MKSDILDKSFNLWITTKARKCIMKAGSLDKYLLRTKPKYIDSKFGRYLRQLIKDKQADPENFKMGYIPGTSAAKKTKKTKFWEYR